MKTFFTWTGLIVLVFLLAHCGGGGGGGDNNPTPSPGGEGSISTPVSLGTATTSITRTNVIGAGADSYFSFTSSVDGVYIISLLTNQSDLEWKLFNTSANFSGAPRTPCDADVVGNEICFTNPSLSAGTAYHLKVHNYGGITSNYTLVIAPPATPIVSFPTMTATFESGIPSGWLASGTWGITTTYAHSGTHSVTDSPGGNYLNSTNMYLISPVMDLTGIATPTLTFFHRYDLGSLDGGDVEVSTNGGMTFPNKVKTYTGQLSTFTQVIVDLSAYKTDKVVIRFYLYSDISGTYDGWYIDDIVIQ